MATTSFKRKGLEPDELDRLMKAARGNLVHEAILQCMYYFALRATELCGLDEDDFVSGPEGDAMIIRRAKGGISRKLDCPSWLSSMYIGPVLTARSDDNPALFVTERGKRWTKWGLRWLIEKYAAEARLPRQLRRTHVLRHTMAIRLLDEGSTIPFVANYLGHQSYKTTERSYAAFSAAASREKMATMKLKPDVRG